MNHDPKSIRGITRSQQQLKQWKKPTLTDLNVQDTKTGVAGTITDGTTTNGTTS